MQTLTLVPAYGRDYKNKKDILADWDADKDFLVMDIRDSGYINKQQVPELKENGVTHLHFRYKKHTSVMVMEVK